MTIKALAVVAAMMAGLAVPAGAVTYVGSFWVGSGPEHTTNPPSYSALEAAALIFGGAASDYAVSVDRLTVTHTAWVDGFTDTSHLLTDWADGGIEGTPVAETFSFQDGTGYENSGLTSGHAYSAYVLDNELLAQFDPAKRSINYVFRLIDLTTHVPEPASWAMMIAGFGLAGVGMRRRALRPI